jgi:hypothetical protein
MLAERAMQASLIGARQVPPLTALVVLRGKTDDRVGIRAGEVGGAQLRAA